MRKQKQVNESSNGKQKELENGGCPSNPKMTCRSCRSSVNMELAITV